MFIFDDKVFSLPKHETEDDVKRIVLSLSNVTFKLYTPLKTNISAGN